AAPSSPTNSTTFTGASDLQLAPAKRHPDLAPLLPLLTFLSYTHSLLGRFLPWTISPEYVKRIVT
ncbi:MAG: hypothetical protein PHR35_07450, partial [Kiritimatiellae bacterium]|nr:hypothetical protein [Kiritimatiellia bacterium]